MSGTDRQDESRPGAPASDEASITIPVVEERLLVDKREVVSDHVVVRKTIEEHDAIVDVLRRTQDVSVERVR